MNRHEKRIKIMDEQDFGNDYLEFFPNVNGMSQVCIDGWFTSTQLRKIAADSNDWKLKRQTPITQTVMPLHAK